MTRHIPYGIIHNDDWSEEYMAQTDAQKKAKDKYYKEKVKRILLEFYPSDAELFEKVQAQPSKQTYIKDLIRKDLK